MVLNMTKYGISIMLQSKEEEQKIKRFCKQNANRSNLPFHKLIKLLIDCPYVEEEVKICTK